MRVIESFSRGLKLLTHIAQAPHGVKVSELAAAFDLPSSNLSLFLHSMVAEGFVLRDEGSGRYHLSGKMAELASLVQADPYGDLKRLAQPVMQRLSARFDENVLLGVLQAHRLTFIERRQSTRQVQVINSEETSYLPHVTAAGKAILAFKPPKELEQYLKNAKYQRFNDKTKTRRTEIEKELSEIRSQGYAINRGEFEAEVMAVSAPVLGKEGVLASLTVQFPTFRYQEKELHLQASEVSSAARELSQHFARPQRATP